MQNAHAVEYSVSINLATSFSKLTAKFHQKDSKADALKICPCLKIEMTRTQFPYKFTKNYQKTNMEPVILLNSSCRDCNSRRLASTTLYCGQCCCPLFYDVP